MSGRRRDDDAGRGGERFADLFSDAAPLAGEERVEPPGSRASPATPPTPERRSSVPFVHEPEVGDGRAEDVSRRVLAKLRRGEFSVEREVDLHGLRAAEAERVLRDELVAALAAGERCVLVIHGAGRRSRTGPVLKGSLPGWIERAPCADRVMAWASAPRRRGGEGATLVLLRRTRQRT